MAHQVVFFATASGTYAMAVAVPGGAAAAATLGRYADEFLGALSPAAKALDDAKSSGDAFQVYLNRDASGAFRVAGAVAAGGLGGVFAAALVPWWVPVGTGLAVAVVGGYVAGKFYEKLFDGAAGSRIGDILPHEFWDDVFDTGVDVNTFFNQARNWVCPRDPFALDLDGDGIETTGDLGRSTVLFDHDADGILTGTGWLRGDDAWLVLDRDGDNLITSGAELFGVDTPLATGTWDTVMNRPGFVGGSIS